MWYGDSTLLSCFLIGALLFLSPEGGSVSRQSGVFRLATLYSGFFGVYTIPLWFALPSVCYMRKKGLAFSIFVTLFGVAYWYIFNELGRVLTLSEISETLISISYSHSFILMFPVVLLLGFNLGLLFLPERFRFQIFITFLFFPIAALLMYV